MTVSQHSCPESSSNSVPIEEDADEFLPPPPPILQEPVCNQKEFERGDIVWMKSGKIFKPGVVVGIKKKAHIAHVKQVNSVLHKTYRRKFHDLVDFKNGLRNRRLMEANKKYDHEIKRAFDKVNEFFCLKRLKENICAIHFLTNHKYKSMYEIFNTSCNCNSMEEHSKDSDDNSNDEDVYSDGHDEENDNIYNSGISDSSPEFNKEFKEMSQNIYMHMETELTCETADNLRNVFSVESDVLSCDHIIEKTQQTHQEREERLEEAKMILSIVSSEKCRKHLKSIFSGKCNSIRHEAFITKSAEAQKNLELLSGLGPFSTDVLGFDLIGTLDKYLYKFDDCHHIESMGSRIDYLFNVFIPEAILFALQDMYGITLQRAEILYKYKSSRPWY